jgi:hypothetical protein
MTNLTAALTILYNETGRALDEPMTVERAANLRAAIRIVEMALPSEPENTTEVIL